MKTRQRILDSMARTIFVLAWADACEEAVNADELTAGFPGSGLMNLAPETSEGAKLAADKLAAEVERHNCASLDRLYRYACKRKYQLDEEASHRKDPTEADFGYCIAMMAAGHGVSWEDDHPMFNVPDLPTNRLYREFEVPLVEYCGYYPWDAAADCGIVLKEHDRTPLMLRIDDVRSD